jgi:hypothetical protein
VTGIFVQIAAVLATAVAYLYATQYIPNAPILMSGKGISHTPRDDFLISIAFVFAVTTAIAAVLNIIGLLQAPRYWKCTLASLPSILVVGAPFVWVIIVQVINAIGHAL